MRIYDTTYKVLKRSDEYWELANLSFPRSSSNWIKKSKDFDTIKITSIEHIPRKIQGVKAVRDTFFYVNNNLNDSNLKLEKIIFYKSVLHSKNRDVPSRYGTVKKLF